jgi:tetratricopeptide (TPR) repeat protein
MRTSCRARTSIIAGALFLLPALARAEAPVQPYPPCDRTPSKGDSAAAEGAFQAGNASYGEADYDRAINYWEDAYRRDCTAHAMLLNLARAYEINGQKRHAVNALRTYMARNPNSSDEAQIKRRIEKLDEQIQAEQAAAAPPPPGPAQPVGQPPPPMPGAAPAAPVPEQPAPTGKRPIAPLIVVGIGGVATIVGGVLFFTAASRISDIETQCGGRVCNRGPDFATKDAQLAEDANSAITRQNVGAVVGGVGIAAVAGGLIWYFTSKPSNTAPAAMLSPSLAPGFAGASFAGHF